MKNLLPSHLGLLLILFTLSPTLKSQVSVDTTLTVTELVNDVLLGPGISATNITFNGAPADSVTMQVGSFTIDSSAFPIAQGVVMGTGQVTGIAGGDDLSISNTFQDDPDLLAIGAVNMNNCAVIEFDFIALTDTFLIDYVFASTEYPNFTCSAFNDAFGIFISGPGISGPFTNNAENIALIPNSDIPVAINTVNSGVPSLGSEEPCIAANPNFVDDSIYFFDNDPAMENSISYPGHTHMFTAFASLEPGSQYHFKFALGNAVDQALQSAVLMRSGSISSGLVENELELEVNTEGIDVAPEGIFVAGTFNYFVPEPMEAVAENVYRFAANVPPHVNVTYKFFNGNGPEAGEIVPEDCAVDGVMANGNRIVTMPNSDFSPETICFGTCDICPGGALSVDEATNPELKIYPNPSTDGTFQFLPPADGFARIQAFDIQGKMLLDRRVFVNQGNAVEFTLPGDGLFKLRLFYEDDAATGYSGTVVVE